MRPFAIEEPGSPVPALYATLGKSRLALIFTPLHCAVEWAPVDGTNYEFDDRLFLVLRILVQRSVCHSMSNIQYLQPSQNV